MFKHVWDAKFEQDGFGHRFNVGAVAGTPLVANITRLKAVFPTIHDRAVVTTKLLAFCRPVLHYGLLLAAVETCDCGSMMGIPAFIRTILGTVPSCPIDIKRLATVRTLTRRLCFSAFPRAKNSPLLLACLNSKSLTALWASLFSPIASAFIGAKSPTVASVSHVDFAALFASAFAERVNSWSSHAPIISHWFRIPETMYRCIAHG